MTETAQRSRGKTSDSSGFFRPCDPDYVALKHSGSADKTTLLVERHITRCATEELKVGRFEPEYLGKLSFSLEALDRDVRKPHEQPSIGVLLCASKEDEVVEYALSRTLSPALIAEYQTQLPDKKILQAKLHEFYLQNFSDSGDHKEL